MSEAGVMECGIGRECGGVVVKWSRAQVAVAGWVRKELTAVAKHDALSRRRTRNQIAPLERQTKIRIHVAPLGEGVEEGLTNPFRSQIPGGPGMEEGRAD